MADFITTIALRDAEPSSYPQLDLLMSAANFSRQIRSPQGYFYDLPAGVYFSRADGLTSADVRNLALKAAHTFRKPYDIVTVSGDVAFFLHPAGQNQKAA